MINLYAYTYPSATKKYPGYILTKVGDSTRQTNVRIGEQGGAAEWESKIHVGAWNNLQTIKRDHDVHKVLTKRGLHNQDGLGKEWFIIPSKTVNEAANYIDTLVADFEGKKVRNKIKLRKLQQKALDEALDIIVRGGDTATIIAHLCPRFGKTIWALMLFNEATKRYGNRVMLLPAYWLSVHKSFMNELGAYDDFLDIALVEDAKSAKNALENNQRIIIPVSLHGDYDEWTKKNRWVRKIDNNDIFVFADEGDFGTHSENQIKKLEYILC